MKTTTHAVIEKIRKLLLLSQHNSNVAEAALAAAKAKEIALKYNIGLELLNKGNSEHIINFIDEFGIPFWKLNPEQWEMLLADIVANHNGCRILSIDIENDIALTAIGRISDIEISKTLIEWLRDQIFILSLDESGESLSWVQTFRLGAIHKINARMDEVKSAVQAELVSNDNVQWALSKIDLKLVEADEFIKENLRSETGSMLEIEQPLIAAFNKGYLAGNNVRLHKEMKKC